MSGDSAGRWGYSNGTTMEGSITLTEGDTYIKDPVMLSLRLWPVKPVTAPGVYAPRFARKIVKSIAVKASGVASFTESYADSANQVKVGVYRNQRGVTSDSLACSNTVAISENPSECIATPDSDGRPIDGITLEPYIEQVSCGTDFELTGVNVKGTITESKNVET